MTDQTDRPTIAEIAALTGRLRALSDAGRSADRSEVARFLADKHDLIERITSSSTHADPPPSRRGSTNARAVATADEALRDVARARAEAGGYVLVGPSAETWQADPDGRPVERVTEPEHRAVRALMGGYELDATEPRWIDRDDGQSDIVSAVIVPTRDDDPSDAGLASSDQGSTDVDISRGAAASADAHKVAADDTPVLHEHRAIVNRVHTAPAPSDGDAVEQARRAVAGLANDDGPHERPGRGECTTYAHLLNPDAAEAWAAAGGPPAWMIWADSGGPRDDRSADDRQADAAGQDVLDREFDELIERHPLAEYEGGADGRGWWVDNGPVDAEHVADDNASLDDGGHGAGWSA